MSWLLFAILARLFWAGTNLIDQYMVRFAVGGSALVVMIAENLVILPTIIVLACIVGTPITMKPITLLWLIGGVAINMLALFPYFLALKNDEAHNAIPLMELTPVILTFLAWLIFGDALSGTQLTGASLVILGGFLFAWDFKHGRFRLKTAALMGLSSACFAAYQLALRYGAQREQVWSIMLVLWIGYFISAIILFVVLPVERRLLIESIRKSRGKILAVAFAEELLAAAANICLILAFSYAPRAGQVAALSATQPVFVLLISVGLGLLLPHFYPRLVWDWEMKIKCLLLLVIAVGIILLKAPGAAS